MNEQPVRTWSATLPEVKKRPVKRHRKNYIKQVEYLAAGLEPPRYKLQENYKDPWEKRKERQQTHKRAREYTSYKALAHYHRRKGNVKYCTSCDQTLAISEFDRRHAPNTNTYHSYCKRCRKKHNKLMYQKRLLEGRYSKQGYIKQQQQQQQQ